MSVGVCMVSGKTMLAKRLPSILPTLSATESIETTRVYSALGRLQPGQPLMVQRPFRSPHHTFSDAGLVGGGSPPAPGEVSLANNGVLFPDELPEFNRRTLEVMRQPLEDRVVTISRAMRSTTFPANFMLIAALNPCPCGYRTDPRRSCNCTPPQIERYMSRISGPLLDRHINGAIQPLSFCNSRADQNPGSDCPSLKRQGARSFALNRHCLKTNRLSTFAIARSYRFDSIANWLTDGRSRPT